jgi:hypothetical protein
VSTGSTGTLRDGAIGCRFPALDASLYRPSPRPARWRQVWRAFNQDPRLDRLRRCERRACRALLLALHRVRDYTTGRIDAAQEVIAEAMDYGTTVVGEIARLVQRLGYVEIVPTRKWDLDAQPPGWRGREARGRGLIRPASLSDLCPGS